MTTISKTQRRYLRALANPLKPTVMLGKQGLTFEVLAKIERELLAHELIKIRLLEFKDQKTELAATMLDETEAALVGILGNVITLYRPHPEAERRQIRLPVGISEEHTA